MASRKWWYLQGNWTICDGPGVPETAKGRKKTLVEFSVFSVTQKRRRDTILTILGSTLRLTFGSFFMKKRVFLQTCFFFNFVMFLGGGRRRRRGPSSLKTLKKFNHNSITPCSPKGVRRIYRLRLCRRPQDGNWFLGVLDEQVGWTLIRLRFRVFSVSFFEFEVPWSSLLESLGSFWKTLGWLWTTPYSLWGSFAPLGSYLGCLGGSLDVPRRPLGANWVHFNVFWVSEIHLKRSRMAFWWYIEK